MSFAESGRVRYVALQHQGYGAKIAILEFSILFPFQNMNLFAETMKMK